MTARTKILFDTDPGIDDAMALLMLARDPRAELVGVTAVFGNAPVDITTRNALALCERFGLDVPVARGAACAMVQRPQHFAPHVHGDDGLGNIGTQVPQRLQPHGMPAHQLISEMSRRHAGELTLVAVGPLTNLALALQHDPQIVERVRQVVVMGGAFGTLGHSGNVSPVAEANVANDPHAAEQVFAARWPVAIVGLDVTHQVLMSTAYLDALGEQGGEDGRFVRDITRHYEAFYNLRTGGGIYSHDASAVAYALDPSAFRVRHGEVHVATEGVARGQTIQWPDRSSDDRRPQAVCVGVDARRLLDDYRALFTR